VERVAKNRPGSHFRRRIGFVVCHDTPLRSVTSGTSRARLPPVAAPALGLSDAARRRPRAFSSRSGRASRPARPTILSGPIREARHGPHNTSAPRRSASGVS